MTKMKDIRNMKDTELTSLVNEKREEIRNFHFNAAARDVRAVRAAKNDIARALTELNDRAKANTDTK